MFILVHDLGLIWLLRRSPIVGHLKRKFKFDMWRILLGLSGPKSYVHV